MEILQLPITALQERIQQELQENPVLEVCDTSTDELAPGEAVNQFQDHQPDVVVERTAAGDYAVRLIDGWTPNISVSRRYLELYRDPQADPKVKEYLKRMIQAARWLLESIEQRRNTLEKITRAIIQHQRAFLDKGPDHIAPLKMQQIADQVGVQVTTISRAVDGKWLQTPDGLFPLRCFFAGPGNSNDL
jgi:RNA polymerase sigma-54 factor